MNGRHPIRPGKAGPGATSPLRLREERPEDAAALAALIAAAFRDAPHASGEEAAILDGLRAAGALTLSLLAERDGLLLGQAAFSPVRIVAPVRADAPAAGPRPQTPEGAEAAGWFGLGPLAVAPGWQRQGVGGALVREGLARLGAMGAAGCVVLGDPGYYHRFGFRALASLRYPGPPAEYFQTLLLRGPLPEGEVVYHRAFGA